MDYFISSGQVSSGIILDSWDYMEISSGGMANSTTVNSDGRMYVSSGGTANSTIVNGIDYWYNGNMYVCSGGTADSTTVNYGGAMSVDSGGVATNITIAEGGILHMTVASNTYIQGMSAGSAFRMENAFISGYTVNFMEKILIHSGGMANNTTVNDGWMQVSSGGTVECTTVNGGQIDVSSGGIMNSTVVNDWGKLSVSSGGTANNASVNASGCLWIESGGTATGIVENGGYVGAEDGAEVTFIPNTFSGVVTEATVHSGNIADDITVCSWGCMIVYSGGIANRVSAEDNSQLFVSSGGMVKNTAVNGGHLYVSSGGTASSTTVRDWGTLYVFSGGTATNITIAEGGQLRLMTVAPDTYIQGTSAGSAFLMENAYISGYVVNNSDLEVFSGGTATDITITGSGHLRLMTVAPDTYIQGTSAGSAFLMENAYISGYTVDYYDALDVLSGGTADSTIINSGGMAVSSGGTASSTTVNNGLMFVYSGGTANSTTVNSGGEMYVSSGGTATDVVWTPCVGRIEAEDGAYVTYVSSYSGVYFGSDNQLLSCSILMENIEADGNTMYVMANGTANKNTISYGRIYIGSGGTVNSNMLHGGSIFVSSGGTANATTVYDYGRVHVFNGGIANGITVYDWSEVHVSSGGTADSTTVKYLGYLYVSSGGTANSTIVNYNGYLLVSGGGTANSTTVNSGGCMEINSGVTASNTMVNGGGNLYIYDGIVTGSLQIADGAAVYANEGSEINFDLRPRTTADVALVNDLSMIQGTPTYTITISAVQAFGQYSLAGGAAGFTGTLSLGTAETNYGSITVNGDSLAYGDYIFTLTTEASDLLLTVASHNLTNLQGDPSGLRWIGGAGSYMVQYSTDDFATVMQVEPGTSALDSFRLPMGTYQWRVCSTENGEWVEGNNFAADAAGTAPKLLQSDADGDLDVFFAQASGTWNASYYAQHQGTRNTWSGTSEKVALNGKNRIADIFEGSDDANVLVLTDAANGDALFVDDIYSAFPDGQQSRIAKINEIRAGAGDDIVDMTSQLFYYSGDGMTIRGGDGNDTIWANRGDNKLFGDAGNDRLVGASGDDVLVGGSGNDSMHGGGGSDIFAFGENWGNDTVEQLTNGKVTLWFASGDISKWDADTLTYVDGENSVKVSGVTEDKVTLKFGNDTSEQYGTLSASGAFADASSEKIFEDKDKGMLA